MKTLLLLSFVLALTSCNRYSSSTERKQLKKAYISEFKMTYFKTLLLTAYNNSESIKNIIDKDASSFAEPILSLDDIQIINQNVGTDNKIMITDSVNSYNKAEGAQGKSVFSFAINKYNSKSLDRLAKKRYKGYRKLEKDFEKKLRKK